MEDQVIRELQEVNKKLNTLIESHNEAFKFMKETHEQLNKEVENRMSMLKNIMPPDMKNVNIGEMMRTAMDAMKDMSSDQKSFDDSILRKPRREYPPEPEDDQDNAAGAKKEDLK